MIVFLHIL